MQQRYVVLPTGQRIRYTLLKRPSSDSYYVRYRSMDGRRMLTTTGCLKMPEAIGEAHRIILEAYEAIPPSSQALPWELARRKLEESMRADGKRSRTIKSYLETLKRLQEVFPSAKGPADITDRMAEEFKTKYAIGHFIKQKHVKEGEVARSFERRPETLDSRLRMLKAGFGWFKKLRLIAANPFEHVTLPELDRPEVKYVKQVDITRFFGWLEGRFPGWQMPKLFFKVKAATGCRLQDVCSLRSHQLRDGRIVFPASTTKNRRERFALLPDDVYAALEAYKGQTYLWENYPPELIAENKKKGFPTHRQNPDFSPERLYLWVQQIMGYYQKQTGEDFSSHDFRRAAFTRAAEKDIHPKRASVAFDTTPETMLRYYTATDKMRTADEVLADLADDLLPKECHQIVTKSPPDGDKSSPQLPNDDQKAVSVS